MAQIDDIIADIENQIHEALLWLDGVTIDIQKTDAFERIEIDAHRLTHLGLVLQEIGDAVELCVDKARLGHNAKTPAKISEALRAGFETLIAEAERTTEALRKTQGRIQGSEEQSHPVKKERNVLSICTPEDRCGWPFCEECNAKFAASEALDIHDEHTESLEDTSARKLS